MLIRARYLVDAIGFNKIKGKPFAVSELFDKIREVAATIKSPVEGKSMAS